MHGVIGDAGDLMVIMMMVNVVMMVMVLMIMIITVIIMVMMVKVVTVMMVTVMMVKVVMVKVVMIMVVVIMVSLTVIKNLHILSKTAKISCILSCITLLFSSYIPTNASSIILPVLVACISKAFLTSTLTRIYI